MKRKFVKNLLILFIVFILSENLFSQPKNESVNNLDEKLKKIRSFIDTSMKAWQVPGIGIGIIKDGRIIMSEGFGIRSINNKLPVTSKTLFAIASCSKAFTVADICILSDEKKIDWDKPVRNYYPSFKLKDNFSSERMTLRDMVTHRSGLPRHDMLWYGTIMSRKELIDRLEHLEPSKDFRSAYQYQNLMFMAAGYIAGIVNGSTWEEMTKEKIFRPLGMNRSNFSVNDSKETDDYAIPHQTDSNDKLKEIQLFNVDELGPAGSINSNIEDMLKWVNLNLNRGKHEGKQILSESQILKTRTPQMAISSLSDYPTDVSSSTYGMGWFINYYRGHYRAQHGGNIDGFSSNVTLLPIDSIGIVVLSNLGGNPLPGIIIQYATDLFLNLDPIDWHGRIKSKSDSTRKAAREKNKEDRVPGTKPSHNLNEFAGEYENPAYGSIFVAIENKNLKIKYNIFNFNLEHWHYDVFKSKPIEVEDDDMNYLITFYTNPKGEIDKLSIPLESAVKDILFEKKIKINK